MFYTIYKTTNKVNNKVYIGKHQTKDLNDGYLGSGKLLVSAIEKHGSHNFIKEILFVFDNESEMNAKEAELVSEEFIKEETNYNLCPGGKGGWGYNNTEKGQKLREFSYERWSKAGTEKFKLLYETDEGFRLSRKAHLKKASKIGLETYREKYPKSAFFGKKHTDESKRKIRESNSNLVGSKNSQFGTMWITNGKDNKKIKRDIDIIPEGWYRGRVI